MVIKKKAGGVGDLAPRRCRKFVLPAVIKMLIIRNQAWSFCAMPVLLTMWAFSLTIFFSQFAAVTRSPHRAITNRAYRSH